MRYNDDLMRWYVGTRAQYDKIPLRDRDENGSYFLLDTKEVVFDGTSYLGILIFYSGEKPSTPSTNRLYMNTDNLEVSVWDGLRWLILYGSCNAQLISADPELEVTRRAVSGIVVEDYAKRIVEESVLDYAEYINLAWNADRRKLEFQIGSSSQNEFITTFIGNRISLDEETKTMYLFDEYNNVLSSVNLFPRHVISGKFNITTATIDFEFSNGPTLKVPAGQMMNLFRGESTASIITGTSTENGKTLDMRVKRSREYDNLFKLETDGIYASYVRYMDKMNPGLQNMILVANKTDGNRQTISDMRKKTISTEFVKRFQLGDEDKVVTEYVVWNALQQTEFKERHLKKVNIWNNLNDRINFSQLLGMIKP